MERLWEQRRHQEGFSLIELLVVIVILGVLAGVVVFAVGGITDRGETSACKADYKTIQVAEEAYFAQEGTYTSSATLASGGFLADPSTNYSATGSASSYTITPATDSTCPANPFAAPAG